MKLDIESCLKTGYEKLDYAMMFKKARKYPGAIPLYIRAYEEIGFGLFLIDKVCGNEQIAENNWKELVKPGSHNQKILSNYITIKDQMMKNTDDDFEKVKKSEIGKSFPLSNRLEGLEAVKDRISIYSKLDKLRQKFDHSHELDGNITEREYDNKDLEAVCYLLESECLASYYRVRLGLESYPLISSNDSDQIKLSKINSVPAMKKLKELSQEVRRSGIKLRKKGLRFIKSI